MSKNYENDQYDEIAKFGDIDSVFELDQSALEEEVEEDYEIDQETRDKYMVNEDKPSDNVDYDDSEDDDYDFDEELALQLGPESKDETEVKESIDVETDTSETEETTSEEAESEEEVDVKESETEDNSEIESTEILDTTEPEVEESETEEDVADDEPTLKDIINSEEATEEEPLSEEEQKLASEPQKLFESPNNHEEPEIKEESTSNDTKSEEDDDIPEIESPEDIEKRVKENSTSESYDEFMKMSFRTRVDSYYQRYSEEDILKYLEQYDDPDDKEIIKDLYITEYVKYSQFINFEKNPEANNELWVLVAGMFADTIEHDKYTEKIKPEIVSLTEVEDPNLISDPNIEETKLYQKQQKDKYDKYKIDRTIFDIRDDEDVVNSSIFDDKRTLDRDFYESEFYKIHKEVMTPDRYCDMSNIHSTVRINIDTSYLPVIDYSTGVRVICIDTNDTDQYRINPLLIHRKIQFAYRIPFRDIKLRVLYSDNAKNNPHATIAALKKLVAYKYINDKYKITLNRNYTIAYTTDPKFIDMFEQGDPDSKRAESSYTFTPKPYNCQLGVIVLDKKTDKDRKSIRRNQIRRDIGKYEKPSVDDYDIHFVLSARVVKNDLRLRNPALPPEERFVEYLITQYTETNSVIIKDGFQVITACLIKEHIEKYGRGVGYSVSYEYDRDGLVSPAVVGMLDARDGVVPQQGSRPNSIDVLGEFILPPSRLKLDGVFPFERGRLDVRNFAPITIQRRYPRDLWSNYDLSTLDGRYEFIRSRGFEEFIKMKPIVFDIEPSALNMLFSGDMIRNITKVSMEALRDKNSADTETILYKQSELEYINSLGDGQYSTFHKMLFTAFDSIIDAISKQNK